MTDLPTYALDRTFDAPASLVWRAWTDPKLVPRWYGPGVTSIVHKMDVRTGGVWLHEMRWGDTAHFQRMEYTAVDEPTRLAWLHHTTNDAWETVPNPQMPGWPRTLDTEVTFAEVGGKTEMKMTWTPHDPTPEEVETFKSAMEGMSMGWGKGMDVMAEILAELQA